jgi:hypothetical protein
MNCEGCGWKLSWPNGMYYHDVCLAGLRKTMENLSQETLYSDRDLNPGPPEYMNLQNANRATIGMLCVTSVTRGAGRSSRGSVRLKVLKKMFQTKVVALSEIFILRYVHIFCFCVRSTKLSSCLFVSLCASPDTDTALSYCTGIRNLFLLSPPCSKCIQNARSCTEFWYGKRQHRRSNNITVGCRVVQGAG